MEGNYVNSLAFSPDGQVLATGGLGGSIVLWDVKTWQPLGEALHEHEGRITSLVFDPQGTVLASGYYEGYIVLWMLPHAHRLGIWSANR